MVADRVSRVSLSVSIARPKALSLILTAILTLSACTSSTSGSHSTRQTASPSPPSPTGSAACTTSARADSTATTPKVAGGAPNAPLPIVTGRCDDEVDLKGPGINFSGTQTFGVNGGSVAISASNCYTIGATTTVPMDVKVSVDPVIKQTPTSERRFQYLGDLLGLIRQPTFCPSGLFAIRSPGAYLVIGVIRNSGDTPLHLRGLHVTLTESPPSRVVGDNVLFASGSGLTLPPDSMRFFETTFSANGVPDAKATTDSFNFHWNSLLPARAAHCT
jgi:hypothetical protein